MFYSIFFIFLLERAINKPTIFFLALVKKINFLSLILIEYKLYLKRTTYYLLTQQTIT
jgi:hypothetical protein